MPHVDDRVRHGLTVFGKNGAIDIERIAFCFAADVGAECRFRGILYIERTLHRGLRCAFGKSMIDSVHQHGNTQRVGQQNKFLPLVGAQLARAREIFDGLFPFGFGWFDVAHKIVQVLHQAGHDLLEPRIGGVLVAIDYRGRDVVLVKISHRS